MSINKICPICGYIVKNTTRIDCPNCNDGISAGWLKPYTEDEVNEWKYKYDKLHKVLRSILDEY